MGEGAASHEKTVPQIRFRRARRRNRRLVFLTMTISIVLLASACSGSNPAPAPTSSFNQETSAATSSASETICDIVRSPVTGKVVDALLKIVTGGRYEGGLASNIVVTYVQQNCSELIGASIKAVQGFSTASPLTLQIAGIDTFRSQFSSSLDSTLLAIQFQQHGFPKMTGNAIDSLTSNLCNDVLGKRNSTPSADVKAVLPGADLAQIDQVNRLYSLTLNRCSLDNYQADGLLSNLTDYLISNVRIDLDFLPPIVFGPTWTRTGATSISLSWSALDASGIRVIRPMGSN
jgi:hypothetical protein